MEKNRILLLTLALMIFFCKTESSIFEQKHIYTNHKTKHSMMHGMYGYYPMTREASGTSWVPTSTPEDGFMLSYNNWDYMFLGFSYFVTDVQRGKRGAEQIFDENMFMIMAQRNFEYYTFAIRSMFSLEPLTIGKCGYPSLLQTGETCDGITPLIDRQHPHDLFMELALVNMFRLAHESSLFLYLGYPGEPALGPPVYMMRYSAMYIPETPLGHHWMDSTHITFGVITLGLVHKGIKLEFSAFNGREPDEDRFDFDKPKIDSYSVRLSFNPTDDFAFQASYGFLKSPEQLEPNVSQHRYIASLIYNKRIDELSNFQGSAILGVIDDRPGDVLPAFLLEGTLEWKQKHLFFSRYEWLRKEDLFIEPSILADCIFAVQKVTVGYVYEFLTFGHVKWGIGGLVDFPIVPEVAKCCYGKTISPMVFLQIRLV